MVFKIFILFKFIFKEIVDFNCVIINLEFIFYKNGLFICLSIFNFFIIKIF